jgi:hypothetical protein
MEGNFLFFLKDLNRYILEEMFERKADLTVTDNTVTFGFRGFINLSSTLSNGVFDENLSWFAIIIIRQV